MTTWATCRCTRRHATERTMLRCKIPGLAWVTGKGSWALIAWCGSRPTACLWPTQTEALDTASVLCATGCGRPCRSRHDVVQVRLDPEPIQLDRRATS